MIAHEHQLSDITETCRREAALLDCLRDSKLEFNEYLKQVDEMLSRKVSSIKDLQTQINRLRSYRKDDDDDDDNDNELTSPKITRGEISTTTIGCLAAATAASLPISSAVTTTSASSS